MAVQIESRGQIQDFVEVLRRRAWQIVVPAVFIITIGSCLAVIIPRKFLAKTQIELRQSGPTLIGKEGQNAPVQITAPERIKSVVEEKLKPPAYQALGEMDRRDFLKDIDKNTKVVPQAPGQQSSIFLTITYTDVDRVWAGTFLRALRDDWQQDVLEQDRNKLNEEVQRLGEQCDKLKKRSEREESELSDLKRKSGLSAMQPIPGASTQQTEDPEYNRLQLHKGQVVDIDIKLAELHGRQAKLQQQLLALPDKVKNERVLPGSNHQKELDDLEAKIHADKEKLKDYKPPHSIYISLQEQIDKYESRLEELKGAVTASAVSSVDVDNPARADVRKKLGDVEEEIAGKLETRKSLAEMIEGEKETVEKLHDVYREVRLREENIRNLRADFSAVDLAYQKKVQDFEIVKSPKNNPFAILEEVNVPPKATEPNPWLIVALSVAAGLGLGVGIAVLLEYTKSCFRSVYDVSRVLPVPVLGNINRIVTRRESRQKLLRRILVGTASALVLGSLAFVTWAWVHDQESGLLSPALRKAIEGLRAALK